MKSVGLASMFLVLTVVLAAGAHPHPGQSADHEMRPSRAICVVHPLGESNVRGIVTFTQRDEGVEIVAEVEGLDPNGVHGFHIHQWGDCSGDDGLAAGGHFDPHGHPHGGPDDEHRHVGDLGNLQADENGRAVYRRLDTVVTLYGANSVIGRSIIVHEQRDDLESQPTGDAGPRIACGVIGIAQPEE